MLGVRLSGGDARPKQVSGSYPTPDTRRPRPRAGVTLIELLIVILIISLLAGLVLGVAAIAGETARVQHTRHVIERLHTLLTDYSNTFKTRRVRLNPVLEAQIDAGPGSAAKKGQQKAEARLYALRELMLMEIPDRWSDVLLNAVPSTLSVNGYADSLKPIYLDPGYLSIHGRTQLAETYLRRYQTIAASPNPPNGETLTDNQGAECLYMVIMQATGDGEARTLFAEKSIGDTDGDGALEFLDGWNRPINFLRWAPGFESEIQLNANLFTDNSDWVKKAASDHDPYDVFRMDSLAFRLVPLIYSGGRDETFGVRLSKPHVAWIPTGTPPAGEMASGYPRLSPYFKADDKSDANDIPAYLGTWNLDGTATDNIHNHLMGLR